MTRSSRYLRQIIPLSRPRSIRASLFPLTTNVETDDGIQAYSARVYVYRATDKRPTRLAENDREERREGEVSNKRGIDTTRPRRVINEQDSQDFTGAEVIFVKRSDYHHRHQRRMVENPRAPLTPTVSGTPLDAAPAPLERFAVTVISPFDSLISRRD